MSNAPSLDKPNECAKYLRNLDRDDRSAQTKRYADQMSPCATEDSRNCVWRAAEQGNGTGRSFINLAGVLFYFNGDFVNR